MLSTTALLRLLPAFLALTRAAPLTSPTTPLLLASRGGGGLNPSCAPGGNFDLSGFTLQLPIGDSAGSPQQIPGSQLSGCSTGYQDPGHHYFFTESGDGAMVMKVPGSPSSSGCVTTTNSQHCRTELRENGSWDPAAATNRLSATLSVPTPDNSGHGTVIGQIHIDDSVSSKPVCELFINAAGTLAMGVEQTRSGGDEVVKTVGSVQPGSTFSYEISYEAGRLSVAINGGQPTQLSTYQLDNPKSYFKAGNYNQGSSASDVHFLALSVQH